MPHNYNESTIPTQLTEKEIAMTELEIRQRLDALDELKAQRTVLVADIQAKITELEAERDMLALDLDDAIDTVTKDIKSTVLEHGQSVKATHLHAVWSKPRISWNNKGLDGYAIAHPEILAFRKEGRPSVSIRASR